MANGLFYFPIDTTITSTAIAPVYLDAAPEALTTAAPAVSVQCYFTELDATAQGVAATLADGVVHGQMKRITASVVSGGTTNVTIASPVSSSLNVVTFSVIGDTVDLIWNEEAGYWRILALTDVDRNISTPVAS